ncbi:MAG: DNA primase [Acidobacteria bacterium]|nr:DNA primase [Acidobacteriota bacterium]
MAEVGSFADKVKTQADIVRVVGEYVRLKKAGQNFMGLCPFHSEKSPSFAVHPVKQFYHCFGCGASGDVFKFVMEVEKQDFREAVKTVAEKCGIPIPRERPSSPGERQAASQRTSLVEMHREAAAFFVRQMETTPEGKAARAYLEDRGLDRETITRFGLGYAPSAGDALCRALRAKFNDKLLEASGLASREASGRTFDRFRRRIIFPIADDKGRVIAFGGRALGDDLPKYLNSPETPIYQKGSILYNLDRAKDGIRRADHGILVEGYMDAIAVSRAGIANVVASCGTSLTEPQCKLLGRFSQRVTVNFDPDAAGQAATERSLALLLEKEFEIRVLVLGGSGDGAKADPDEFIRANGVDAYKKELSHAPTYLDYLISRARKMDLTTGEGKIRAVNFLLPYVQRISNRLLRSEWATRIASQLSIEEPVLRESLRKAAAERKAEVKAKPEMLAPAARPAERRLIRMLVEAEDLRQRIAEEISEGALHRGLDTEKIFATLLDSAKAGRSPDPVALTESLQGADRELFNNIVFDSAAPATWAEAESCLILLRRRRVESDLAEVQKRIAAGPPTGDLRTLLSRKQDLRRLLEDLGS